MLTTSFTSEDFVFLLKGAATTLELTLASIVVGTVIGIFLGWARATMPKSTLPIALLMDVFKSVPLLIQFVLFNALKSILGLDWSLFTIGYLVLGLYAAAFCIEIVRGGILSVSPNIRRASRSLGMSYLQDLRFIVLPLAARVIFPGWLNLLLSLMKDTSLVVWIGLIELLRASQIIVTRIQEPLLVLSITGVIYYVMSLVIARFGNQLEKRWQEND